ncbi:MAG: NnrS family protein [Alphaproteobacteria bacterium]
MSAATRDVPLGEPRARPRAAPFPASLFAYGFRPFFLLAGAYAFLLIALWLAEFLTGFWPFDPPPLEALHVHELFYGFVAAAIAGFLLTAVPGWTNGHVMRGMRLAGLVALWALGRAAVLAAAALPGALVAALDLAFLAALLGLTAPVLIRAKRPRNLPILALLAALIAANLLFHLSWLGVVPDGVSIGTIIVIDVVLFLVAMIAGRIIPAFTLNALRRRGTPVEIRPWPRFEIAVLAATALILPFDLAPLGAWPVGIVAAVAALLHALRLARWYGHRTWPEPIVLILHIAYAWIPVGLALKALWLLGGVGMPSTPVHALTAGAFAGMIMAVMTRASLGHTGRPLVAPPLIAASYAFVTLAALVRVFVPLADGAMLEPAVIASAGLWLVAFALFLVVFAPILCRPRPDGRPG